MQGTAGGAISAGQVSAFVAKVMAETGASKVDLVTHSFGGPVARHYLRFLDGAAKVNQLISIAPTDHGTDLSGMVTLGRIFFGIDKPIAEVCGPACVEQVVGSEYLAKLNAGAETVPGPRYIVLATTKDEVATPYQTAFLTGRG